MWIMSTSERHKCAIAERECTTRAGFVSGSKNARTRRVWRRRLIVRQRHGATEPKQMHSQIRTATTASTSIHPHTYSYTFTCVCVGVDVKCKHIKQIWKTCFLHKSIEFKKLQTNKFNHPNGLIKKDINLHWWVTPTDSHAMWSLKLRTCCKGLRCVCVNGEDVFDIWTNQKALQRRKERSKYKKTFIKLIENQINSIWLTLIYKFKFKIH